MHMLGGGLISLNHGPKFRIYSYGKTDPDKKLYKQNLPSPLSIHFCSDCFSKHRNHFQAAAAMLLSTMLPSAYSSVCQNIRPIVMKFHISIYHGIVSATPVSLACQGLSSLYITQSAEHSQIYVYPLCLDQYGHHGHIW